MIILGIAGKKESGKTTLASLIKEAYSDAVIVNFADALKEEVAKACGITVDFLETHKKDFRPLLQWWGTGFRRKFDGDYYWINRWWERIHSISPRPKLVITADVRFKNEADQIRKLKEPVIRINRTMHREDSHASEIELDDYQFDLVIQNDGTLDDLRRVVLEKIIKPINEHRTNL